jgi:hypothetical protein
VFCTSGGGLRRLEGVGSRGFVTSLDLSHESPGPNARVCGSTLCLWVVWCVEQQVAAALHHRLKGLALRSYHRRRLMLAFGL